MKLRLASFFGDTNPKYHLGNNSYFHRSKPQNYMIYFFLVVAAIALSGYFFFIKQRSANSSDHFVSTQAESHKRIKNLSLHNASEDASHILDASRLSFPEINKESNSENYRANPEIEWIIDIVPTTSGSLLTKEDITQLFSGEWRKKLMFMLYGFSTEKSRWTYVNASNSPSNYSKLQVGVNLQDVYREEETTFDPKELQRYLDEFKKHLGRHQINLSIEATESVDQAVLRAKKLVALQRKFSVDALIVLQSDGRFDGAEAWDALQSVGLEWGDGDLFHWHNPEGYGDDYLFSVWTTTPPTYFFPEEIKNGNMNPENLVFGFSIPRCADALTVFEIMIDAATYCQKRLGGKLVDENLQPFNEEKEKHAIKELLHEIESEGIKPGSDKALMMFD